MKFAAFWGEGSLHVNKRYKLFELFLVKITTKCTRKIRIVNSHRNILMATISSVRKIDTRYYDHNMKYSSLNQNLSYMRKLKARSIFKRHHGINMYQTLEICVKKYPLEGTKLFIQSPQSTSLKQGTRFSIRYTFNVVFVFAYLTLLE